MFIRTYKGSIPDRIYMDADNVHVANYIIYKDSEGNACFDAAGLYSVSAEKLEDLYSKGILIFDTEKFYNPVSMSKIEGQTFISYIKYNAVNQTMSQVTISSKEESPAPSLTALAIEDLVLVPPTFNPEQFIYTAVTSDASNVLTLTTLPEDAEVVVKLNGVVVEDYATTGITWATTGDNILSITIGDPAYVYTIAVTVIVIVPPSLTALNFGENIILEPVFNSETFEYAMATTNTSNVLTLTTLPEDAEVVVKLNGVVVEDYATTGITWATTGDNILSITIGDETPVVYTITVAAS